MSSTTDGTMTPIQRVLTSLSFKEPDRVPFFLLLTTHGARELKMGIRDYFSDPEAVAEGQIRMQKRYGHDCLYTFTYAALETEAWGGMVQYTEDGPPNASSLLASSPAEIDGLEVPPVVGTRCLDRTLEATRILKRRAGDSIPIIGVVMSPFSVPVMQLGFPAYLDLIYDDRECFWRLMEKNMTFCTSWANAQLEAGATAICYFDPLASPDMVPPELYLETGHVIASRTIPAIKGPTATHLASGRALPIVNQLAQTGTAILGLSTIDDIADAKRACAGKLTVLGNLNGIEMRTWSPSKVDDEVKAAIRKGGPGGGFILSDNHGEIHHSVPESVLDGISAAVNTWGSYPLEGC
jgi:uroporphyrinogen decarboxylase